VKESLAAWIAGHWPVDRLLHIAAVAVLLAVILAGLGAVVYAALFLLRLLFGGNIGSFIKTPIPTKFKGSFGGAEIELGQELATVLPEFQRETTETLASLEARISQAESQLESWEDVGGKA
jgi:hypothetical protein